MQTETKVVVLKFDDAHSGRLPKDKRKELALVEYRMAMQGFRMLTSAVSRDPHSEGFVQVMVYQQGGDA